MAIYTKASRVNNTIVKNGVTLYIYNGYPTYYIDSKVKELNTYGLDFREIAAIMTKTPIVKTY